MYKKAKKFLNIEEEDGSQIDPNNRMLLQASNFIVNYTSLEIKTIGIITEL